MRFICDRQGSFIFFLSVFSADAGSTGDVIAVYCQELALVKENASSAPTRQSKNTQEDLLSKI